MGYYKFTFLVLLTFSTKTYMKRVGILKKTTSVKLAKSLNFGLCLHLHLYFVLPGESTVTHIYVDTQ